MKAFQENPVNEDKILAIALWYDQRCANDPGIPTNEDKIPDITLGHDPRDKI